MTKYVWTDADGIPTQHAVAAALRVAALIDAGGSRVVDARETYWHVASGAVLPPDDLAIGEALLLDLALVVVRNGVLSRTAELDALLEGDEVLVAASVLLAGVDTTGVDPRAGEDELRARLERIGLNDEQTSDAIATAAAKYDATYHTLLGDIGEDIVAAEARAELIAAGRDDLARAVRRVSLISDTYGYDIVAPRVHGPDRLLEVKATTASEDVITVFLSRHEADVGATRDNWMLVVCEVQDVDNRHGTVVGWVPFESIRKDMPTDGHTGRWESTSVRLSRGDVVAGLPGAFV